MATIILVSKSSTEVLVPQHPTFLKRSNPSPSQSLHTSLIQPI